MKINIPIKSKNISLKDIKKDENKNHKKMQILFVVIIVSILTFFSGMSLGKAVHNTQINGNAEIAKPILEVEKASEIVITEENKEGEYQFTVKNYNDVGEISEVNLQYFIEILEEKLDSSIHYKLYKEGKEMELIDNKTEKINLKKDQKEEQLYTLKVEYDADKNTIGDIMQDIQIKVHSEQLNI